MSAAAWVEVSWRQGGQQARDGLRRHTVAGAPALSLATCARVGWLLTGPGAEAEGARLARQIRAETAIQPVERRGDAALHRLLQVSAGLDSAAEGELDIGRQAVAALGRARALHPEAPFALLEHVLYRLLRQGRRDGWIRARVGVPEAATALVLEARPRSVGVIGAGAMGERVQVALTRAGAPFRWYNRTARPGVLGLHALAPHEAWIVATGARAAWLEPPTGASLIVDLGQPPQVFSGAGRLVALDALLGASALRLSDGQRQRAHAAVDAATEDLISRLRRRAPAPAEHDLGVRP